MSSLSSKDLYEKIWVDRISQKEKLLANRHIEALKEISTGDNFLDIGCGSGLLSSIVKKKFRYIYGLDGSLTALKKMRNERIGTPILSDFDSGSLPIADKAIDLVTCLDVIEHVYDPKKLIEEIYRVLKIGGVLILTTPNIRFIDHIRSIIINGQFPMTSQDKFGYDGGHIHYFTFKDIRILLEKSGFHVLMEKGFDKKNYRTIKTFLFKIFIRLFENNYSKEFFCPGMLVKAIKNNAS